jgi:beta-lactamase regulating signal transducer with metallopeptidase domain
MDKFSLFVLNIFVNGFLAFFTTAFLIKIVIFFLRIQQGRFAAILRMIPIVKLPLDLFLYDFSKWSYSHGVNPLMCETGTRTLSVMFGWVDFSIDRFLLPINSGIQFSIPGNMTFTIADVIGEAMSPILLNCFAFVLLLCSAYFLIKKLTAYRRFADFLHFSAKTQKNNNKKIRNLSIKNSFEKCRLQIVTSSFLEGSPFVAGLTSSIVYISESLSKNLSRKEYEAVLAHEMEHIRHKDNLIRLILDCIGSIFWWIPTKWLQKRIVEGQEIGCDLKCKSYGVDPIDLASAICKSLKHSLNVSDQVFAHHLAQHAMQKRVNLLLQSAPIRSKKIHLAVCFLAAGIAFLAILTGRFWTF